MKKMLLFFLFLIFPFLISAQPADFIASSPEDFFETARKRMYAGDRYFTILADFPTVEYLSPTVVLDAVYRFHDDDPGNDLDDLRENVTFQSVSAPGNRYTFCFYYLSSPEEMAFVERRIERILSDLSLDGKSEAERADAIVKWICRNVTYDGNRRTAFAALREGAANCVGYSVLAFKMLRCAGLGVKIVNGLDCNGIQHAWNLVKIDGLWYNLDVTWGDTGKTDRWFFRGTGGFPDHERFALYNTARFHQLFRMAEQDYCIPLSAPKTEKQ
jgi:hypothetical protein